MISFTFNGKQGRCSLKNDCVRSSSSSPAVVQLLKPSNHSSILLQYAFCFVLEIVRYKCTQCYLRNHKKKKKKLYTKSLVTNLCIDQSFSCGSPKNPKVLLQLSYPPVEPILQIHLEHNPWLRKVSIHLGVIEWIITHPWIPAWIEVGCIRPGVWWCGKVLRDDRGRGWS